MTTVQMVKEDAPDYSHITPQSVQNPHDKFFKETFSHLEVARSFLHHYLPPNVMEHLDTEKLELQKDSFIDKEMRESFSDLLFSTGIAGRKGYIYFLFEHKSYSDKTVAFQLLKYMAEIWNTKMGKENMDQVPPVIPLIIYHGLSGWNIKKTLGGMIAGYEDFSPGIRQFVPDYKYLLYNVTNYTDDEIKGEARVRILLTLFRDVQKSKNIWELIAKAINYLQELQDKQASIEYFETFMLYIINTAKNITRTDVDKVVENVGINYPEGSEVIMTIADIWKEEGKEEGKKEGKREGIRKEKESVVKNALKEDMDLRLIEKLTGLSKKEIEEIAREMEK